VLAIAAHAIAGAEQPPGRRLSPKEVVELLKKTKQDEYVGLDFGPIQDFGRPDDK